MPLKRYMKAGQKVSLTVVPEASENPGHLDALTGYLHNLGRQTIDLTIPYRTVAGEGYPFKEGMKFELATDSMGVGIQLTGTFEKMLGASHIRIKHNNDIKMIRRRLFPRIDLNLEVGYTRSGGKLRSFREQWKKYVKMIEQTQDPEKLPKVPGKKANISVSGIGIQVAPPIEKADIGMFLINLKDKGKPICALAEVIWKGRRSEDGKFPTGFQFLNIMDSDKKRIESAVAKGNAYFRDDEEEENNESKN
ncbi:MAG: PilZ domain-containing protein [Desulfuromonadales bacterium]|nr:PilZ domain-containing protein [Desulfuromonadales bacterium]